MDDLTQLKVDLLYLAERHKIIEDAVSRLEIALLDRRKEIDAWSEFLTKEILSQTVALHKHKKSDSDFKESLKGKFKEDYEKFESLFLKLRQLFGKPKSKWD